MVCLSHKLGMNNPVPRFHGSFGVGTGQQGSEVASVEHELALRGPARTLGRERLEAGRIGENSADLLGTHV